MINSDGIVLAAGLSSRADGWKMGMELHGVPLIVHTVTAMHNAVARVIVVGGYNIERLQQILAPYPFVELVENVDWRNGMFSSVQTGVRRVVSGSFFLTPGDIPYIAPRIYGLLAGGSCPVRIPVYNQKKGHPVWCDSRVVQAVLGASADSNLKQVLQQFETEFIAVDDDGMLFDLDTPEDYRQLQQRTPGER